MFKRLTNNEHFLVLVSGSIYSNFGWAIISEIGGKSLFFLSTVYLSRVLGPEAFGLFSFAQVIVMYFWMTVDLGSNMYGSREVAKQRNNAGEILNALLSMRITSGFVVFVIFISCIYLLNIPYITKQVFIGFSFYLVFRAVFTEWFLKGLEKFNYIALGNLATYGFLLGMLIIFIKDSNDLFEASLIWSGSFLFGGILFVILSIRSYRDVRLRISLNFRLWLTHLRESIHFTFSGGLSSLYQQLPFIYLGIWASKHEVGLYSAVHRLILALVFVFSVYPMSVYPVFSRLSNLNKEKFVHLYKISLIALSFFSLLFALALILWSKRLCVTIFGMAYADAYMVLNVLAGFLVLRSIRELLVIVISALGQQRLYTVASLSSVIIITIAFYLLHSLTNISMLHVAAWSLLITELSMFSYLLYVVKQKT